MASQGYTIAMSWSTRRKSTYILAIVLAIIIFVGVPAFFIFYHPATCSDGKQNGEEQGIDCGGSCPNLCDFQIPKPIIDWVRPAKITTGVYNVLAYVENPNITLGSNAVGYTFKLYDANGLLVAERKGVTSIPPRKAFAIFEGGITTGQKEVQRALFEFTTAFSWTPSASLDEYVSVQDKSLSSADSSPKLTATLTNTSSTALPKIEAVAIVYDLSGNATSFSRTLIDKLDKHESYPLVFTWPSPFQATTSRIEIITRLAF